MEVYIYIATMHTVCSQTITAKGVSECPVIYMVMIISSEGDYDIPETGSTEQQQVQHGFVHSFLIKDHR